MLLRAGLGEGAIAGRVRRVCCWGIGKCVVGGLGEGLGEDVFEVDC